nr:unnamed protein product [Spirometra erinaceieuropaei]
MWALRSCLQKLLAEWSIFCWSSQSDRYPLDGMRLSFTTAFPNDEPRSWCNFSGASQQQTLPLNTARAAVVAETPGHGTASAILVRKFNVTKMDLFHAEDSAIRPTWSTPTLSLG